jgi:site-specific recombinase XerD
LRKNISNLSHQGRAMAQFRRYKGKKGVTYQAIVRLRGQALSRTFDRSDDARNWARAVERAIDQATHEKPFQKEAWLHSKIEEAEAQANMYGSDFTRSPNRAWTLGRALDHYLQTVTPHKKGAAAEERLIKWWKKHPLAEKPLVSITTTEIDDFIRERTNEGRAKQTIRNSVNLISNLYKIAREDWKMNIKNPCSDAKKPKGQKERKRRLREGEEERICQELHKKKLGTEMIDYFYFSISTGLRRGEGLLLKKKNHIIVDGIPYAQTWDSKNGDWRNVVLTSQADEILTRRGEGLDPEDRLFTLSSGQVEWNWRDVKRKAGIQDLHWHDLRHEAISRFVAMGLNIAELKEQSGHRTERILLKYIHAIPQSIKDKIG